MDNSESSETGVDREEWIWLDANGNPVPGENEVQEEWVYVDSEGNLVPDDALDLEAKKIGTVEAPCPNKTKVPKLSKKITHPVSRKKVSELSKLRQDGKKPNAQAPLKIPAHAKAASRSAHHHAPAVTVKSTKLSLWPFFWVAALALAIGSGWYIYTETAVRPALSMSAPTDFDTLPIPIEDPVLVALAPEEDLIESPVEEPAIPVVHPKAVKVFKDTKTIPPQGLIAHYNVLLHTEDLDPNRPPDSQGRVISWGNSVESSANQNSLLSDANGDRLAPKLTIFEGKDLNGKPLNKRVVELLRNTTLSMESNPYSSGKTTWGTAIVFVVSTASTGPLFRLKMAEPEHSGISIYNYGNRLSFTIDNGHEQTSAALDHVDREWKMIYLSWDGESGRMNLSSVSLTGKALKNVSVDVPGFEFSLHHIEIGPDISAQLTDVLIYDRPLDDDDIKQLRRALPARFFDDSKD